MNDLNYAIRQLYKNPGFTAVTMLTLALGIGANTAIFSVINGVLLRPLPYRNPDQLVTVCESNLRRGIPQVLVAPGNLRDWREQNSHFEELGGQIYASLTLSGLEKPEHIHAAWTTPNFFDVFGVKPLLGRTFVAADESSDHRVAVLGHGLWQSRFGGDGNVIGRKITLNGLPYKVVGVMPREFKIYHPSPVFGLPTGYVQPQLWTPYPDPMNERAAKYFLAFARLKAGATAAQAQRELSSITKRIASEFPSQKDAGVIVEPLTTHIVGGVRPALRLLLGAVGFVLLIACANVANLSLARSATRSREFAMRSALGATRLRLARQLFVESSVLALLAGVLGVGLAYAGIEGLTALEPANLPRLDEVRLDSFVLVFTLTVSLVTGIVIGLIPKFHAATPDLNISLKASGRGNGGGRHPLRARNVLVISEVALAIVLLTGAGLLIKSFVRLVRVDPGFQPEHLMTFDFSPTGSTYKEDAKRMDLALRLRDQLEARPGVESAATVYGLPFGTMLNSLIAVKIEENPAVAELGESIRAGWRVVSPNYFETMGASILSGRAFSGKGDATTTVPVAIINEAFQKKFFPNEDPVGKRLQPFTVNTNWHEIVGVVRDVKLTGLDVAAAPEIYQSDTQQAPWMFSLVVRSSLPARQIEKLVRAEVDALDKGLPFFNVRTMEQAISESAAPRRFLMMLIGLFAALAAALTVVGIYSVAAFFVSQRTQEIGIRMALGATRGTVLGLVIRKGLVLSLTGVGIGAAASFALSGLIASQLFEIRPFDPTTLAAVCLVLAMVLLMASYVPARRATRIDPMEALRYE